MTYNLDQWLTILACFLLASLRPGILDRGLSWFLAFCFFFSSFCCSIKLSTSTVKNCEIYIIYTLSKQTRDSSTPSNTVNFMGANFQWTCQNSAHLFECYFMKRQFLYWSIDIFVGVSIWSLINYIYWIWQLTLHAIPSGLSIIVFKCDLFHVQKCTSVHSIGKSYQTNIFH